MICSITGIILFTPLLLIIAALIKMDSPGPALFRQARIGRNFKEFRIFKFRTMPTDFNKTGLKTIKHDRRITRIGRVLRKYNLDELPQLFNIIKGDMSFVGPRPEVPDFVYQYKDDYEILLKERPGITSPASIFFRCEEQLSHPDNDPVNYYITVLMPQKIYLDRLYINERSLSYDLSLIILTIRSLISNQALWSFDKQCRDLLDAQFKRSFT